MWIKHMWLNSSVIKFRGHWGTICWINLKRVQNCTLRPSRSVSLSQGACFYVVIPWEHFICPRAAAFKKWSVTFSSIHIFKEGPSTHTHTHTNILTLVCLYVCRTKTYFIKWDPPALHEYILIFFLYCIYFFFLLLLFFSPYPFLSPSSSSSFSISISNSLCLFYCSLGSMNGLPLLFIFKSTA